MGRIILRDSLVLFSFWQMFVLTTLRASKNGNVPIIFPPIHFKVSSYSSVDESNGESDRCCLIAGRRENGGGSGHKKSYKTTKSRHKGNLLGIFLKAMTTRQYT